MTARLRALTLIVFAAVVALVASACGSKEVNAASATAGAPSDRG